MLESRALGLGKRRQRRGSSRFPPPTSTMPTRFQSVGASRPPRTKSPMCTEAARVEALRHRPLFHTSSSCTTYTEQRYRFMLSPCNSCRRHSWALLGFHLFGWDSDALNCSGNESKTAATVPQRVQSTERMQPRREAMPVVDWIAAEKDFAIGNSAQMLGVDVLETWDHGIARSRPPIGPTKRRSTPSCDCWSIWSREFQRSPSIATS
ncbi:hypothetical protein BKA62DRAFT_52050 [Auriculariales sp. MPI-PUGE-AT-0066]|nr:hypothetical protein BKA62DRAFT_52050 [Auriculariales sp. MPI-PUGE-AT-0066]